MIPEAKFDLTFPSNQSTIEGYAALIRFDRIGRGGILLYIWKDIQQLISKDFLLN